MIFEMSDAQSGFIAESINEAYKNEKFHNNVSCTMQTTNGKWKLYIQSPSPLDLLAFSAHMHFAVPNEAELPEQTEPQDVREIVAQAAQSSQPLPTVTQLAESGKVFQEAEENSFPLESAAQQDSEDSGEGEDDETESAEDAEDAGKSPQKVMVKLPKAKSGNSQKTGHPAVTIVEG
jgi:hypothetical protein